MTASGKFAGSIANVRENICRALEHCDSSNPASLSDCEALLAASAEDLRRLHDAVAAGMAPASSTRLELLNIQSSVNRFLRLVDASSAFVAGLSGVTEDRGLSYDAAGTLQRVRSADDIRNEGPASCRTF